MISQEDETGFIKKNRRRLFVLCWFSYFVTYLARLNLSAAMPQMQAAGFSLTELGAVTSCFFITYGAGQLVNGFLSDRFSPRYMVFFGLFVSGISNIVIGFAHSFSALMSLWAINGFVQSMVWTPLLKIGGDYYDEKGRSKFGLHMSTTVPLGTLAAYGIGLLILKYQSFPQVFLWSGVIVALSALVWLISSTMLLRKLPKYVRPISAQACQPQKKTEKFSLKQTVAVMIGGGLLFAFLPVAVSGALKDSVLSFVPTFIEGNFALGTDFALLLTMILPIVNVTGAYLARLVNRWIKNELFTSVLFFAIAAIALLTLSFLKTSLVVTVISLAVVTTCMFAINVMLITMIPLYFASHGRTGLISGLLNSLAYLGSGLAGVSSGALADAFGWDAAVYMWLALAIAAIVFGTLSAILWKKTKNTL